MSEAIVSYDFVDTFPLWIWVSSGQQMILTRQDFGTSCFPLDPRRTNGKKTEMKRLSGPPAAVRRTAMVFVKGLGESYGIEFDEFDFSDIKTSEEFERRVEELEWPSKSL